jgi:hypothetical protein
VSQTTSPTALSLMARMREGRWETIKGWGVWWVYAFLIFIPSRAREGSLEGDASRLPPLKLSPPFKSAYIRGGVRPEVPVNWALCRLLRTRGPTPCSA